MALDKNFTKTYNLNGHEVEVDIAPCCWMYNSPFQLRVTLKATGQWGSANSKALGTAISFEDATETDVDRMVHELVCFPEPCSCGNPRMLIKGDTTNRGEKCEKCFIANLNAELEKEQEKEKKRVAKRDAKKALEGFTHKLVAWIHPTRGGDDYMVDVYFSQEPTKADIERQLKGSRVKDDYRVEVLPQPTENEKAGYLADLLKKAGLPTNVEGRTVVISNKTFTVASVNVKNRKKGVLLKDEKDARYTCSLETLKKAL